MTVVTNCGAHLSGKVIDSDVVQLEEKFLDSQHMYRFEGESSLEVHILFID
jgi:hypothetical protein